MRKRRSHMCTIAQASNIRISFNSSSGSFTCPEPPVQLRTPNGSACCYLSLHALPLLCEKNIRHKGISFQRRIRPLLSIAYARTVIVAMSKVASYQATKGYLSLSFDRFTCTPPSHKASPSESQSLSPGAAFTRAPRDIHKRRRHPAGGHYTLRTREGCRPKKGAPPSI